MSFQIQYFFTSLSIETKHLTCYCCSWAAQRQVQWDWSCTGQFPGVNLYYYMNVKKDIGGKTACVLSWLLLNKQSRLKDSLTLDLVFQLFKLCANTGTWIRTGNIMHLNMHLTWWLIITTLFLSVLKRKTVAAAHFLSALQLKRRIDLATVCASFQVPTVVLLWYFYMRILCYPCTVFMYKLTKSSFSTIRYMYITNINIWHHAYLPTCVCW